MTTNPTERPTGALSRWKHMSPRERAAACRLVLVAWWQRDVVDVARASTYCTDSDRVCVELKPGDPRGACAFGAVGRDVDAILASIETEYGPAARAWTESTIQQEG